MTREIKLRIWVGNSMGKPWSLEWLKFGAVVPFDFDKEFELEKDSIIMQWTGLKDRNGKEIYEGDIIKTEDGYIIVIESPRWFQCDAFTVFGYAEFGSFIDDYSNDQEISRLVRSCEIIGNIYQNPELVK